MKLVTIFRAFEASQADLAFAQLQAAGLHPELADEDSALAIGTPMAVGGIKVKVPEDEVEDAKIILAPIEPQS